MISKINRNGDALQPNDMVDSYYRGLYSGDLKSVKALMTEESYYMAIEPLGIKLSFRDPAFKREWDKIKESKDSLCKVEKKLSAEFLSHNLSPQIDIKQMEPNGSEKTTVHYKEDGKKKKLYFSKETGHWLIDYYAGRPVPPVPQSYLYSIKQWTISILTYLNNRGFAW